MKEFSIVLQSGEKGSLVYKTLRNIKLAVDTFNIPIEVICIVNKDEKEFQKYIDKGKNLFKEIKVIRYSTGVEEALNQGVEQSCGEYLLFMNAGDLISLNFFEKFTNYVKRLQKTKSIVFLPEKKIFFGTSFYIENNISSLDPSFSPFILLMQNPWGSVFAVKKTDFEKVKFEKINNEFRIGTGVGTFYCRCLEKGFEFTLIEETVVFYELGISNTQTEGNFTIPECKLFDKKNKNLKKWTIDKKVQEDNRPFLKKFVSSKFPTFYTWLFRQKEKVKLCLKKINDNGDSRSILKKIFSTLFPNFYLKIFVLKEKIVGPKTNTDTSYPLWLREQWNLINQVEFRLFSPKDKIKENVPSVNKNLGAYLLEMLSYFPKEISFLIFCPWLKLGGADKLTLNLIRGLKEIFPNETIGIITTEHVESELLDNLPQNIYFFDFGNSFLDTSREERDVLLLRFLVQIRAKNIININSHTLFNLLCKYSRNISFYSKIYCFCFCVYITPLGQTLGFAVDSIPQIIDDLTMVLTDNSNIIEYLTNRFGLDKEKFQTVYQPVDTNNFLYREFSEKEFVDILWASRIDDQKIPYVLEKIIEKSRNINFRFHIYGGLAMNYEFEIKNLSKYDNAFTYGAYKGGIQNIKHSKYDMYLYTSKFDGMPNALLEAMSLGLPVVASNVGGIKEVVKDGKTGYLVNEIENEDAYIRALQKAWSDKKKLKEIQKNMKSVIEKQHSWIQYKKTLKSVFS